jgi:hypothetical protein
MILKRGRNNMENFEKIFNDTYKKYYAKDYFSTREITRNQLNYAKINNIGIQISEVKAFLKNEKQKAYNMMLKRIEEKKQGKIFPKREAFTWAIFKKWEY